MNAVKTFYEKYLRRWVKAIAAAVGGAAAGLFINWLRGTTPIPQDRNEWVTLAVATFGPPLLALITPANKITQKQLDKDPAVIGGTVIDPTVDSRPKGIPGPTGMVLDGVIKPPPDTGGRKSSWK